MSLKKIGIAVLLTFILTIAYQVFAAYMINPNTGLKYPNPGHYPGEIGPGTFNCSESVPCWWEFPNSLFINSSSGNVGIGTTTPESKLEINGSLRVRGNSSYIKLPLLTTAQRDALSPETGMMIYNTNESEVQVYVPSEWKTFGAGAPLGAICDDPSDCKSGFCVDGYCCDSACDGDCEACDLEGTTGYCTGFTADEDDNLGSCFGDCTHCSSGKCVNWPDNTRHEGCNTLCAACQNGSCGYADAGTYQSGCPICKGCNGSELGTCTQNVETNWGAGTYGCTASDARCYGGSCRDCSDSGGYLYDDGCNGCAGQGGKACWHKASQKALSCDDFCGGNFGGCVNANWNDDANCNVCRHFIGNYNCVTDCSGFQCGNQPNYLVWTSYQCNRRPASENQECFRSESNHIRFCVCEY